MIAAPKSDITVAAAGPAIKLAQSMTFSPSKMRSVTNNSLQIFTNEAVRIKRQRFNAEGAKGTQRPQRVRRGRRGKFFGRVAPHELLDHRARRQIDGASRRDSAFASLA